MNIDDAKWIGRPGACLVSWQGRDLPAPYFRRPFALTSSVSRAELLICGLGYYELRLNGAKVGDHVLDPIVTQYDRRLRFVRYDLSPLLRPGEQVLAVILGNGWYNCSTPDVWHFDKASWRNYPRLLLQLRMTLNDGTEQQIRSDASWRVGEGGLRFDALRNGETFEAAAEPAGWDLPGFNDSAWPHAAVVASPGGVMEEQTSPPCRILHDLAPVAVRQIRPGVCVFDFGQNVAGWCRLNLAHATPGQQITLRHSERLDDSGEVNQRNISTFIKGGDCQTDRYIPIGSERESWEPRFTYHGFQYVQVEGLSHPGTPELLTARIINTDFDTVGSFECSVPTINQLQDCTLRAYRGNFVGIPTDCPHREKNGWTGDAQLATETGLLHYDASSSYTQWLDTLADTQRPSGQFPGIAPSAGWGYNWGSGPAWDCAYFLIPWYIYLYTADLSVAQRHLPGMKRYLDFCSTMASDHILSFGLGDWCAPKSATTAPATLTSTAYYYVMADLVARFAVLLDQPHDAQRYSDLARNIRAAFNKRFYAGDGIYDNGSATAQACALYQDLAEPSQTPAVVRELVRAVEAIEHRAEFGILGAKYIPRALAMHGHADCALRIITQPHFPGWVHWLAQGATTLWESWSGDASRNHIMFGDISAWFQHHLAGIQPDPLNPGFRHVLIRPSFVKGVDWVRAAHRCPHGLITVHWQRAGGGITLELELPPGTTGTLSANAHHRALAAGKHRLNLHD